MGTEISCLGLPTATNFSLHGDGRYVNKETASQREIQPFLKTKIELMQIHFIVLFLNATFV